MLAVIITLAVVLLDQISKYLVVQFIPLQAEVDFIPFFINLTHIENRGASFGMLADNRWVFMSLSTLAIVGIIIFMIKFKERHILLTISLSLILGGGIGNMIDRIFKAAVVDFFEFTFVDFAVFNVADMFITFGAVLLGIYMIFYERKMESVEKDKSNDNSDCAQ